MILHRHFTGRYILSAIVVVVAIGVSVLNFSNARAEFESDSGYGRAIGENMCPESCFDNNRKTHDLLNKFIFILSMPTLLAIAAVIAFTRKIQSKKRKKITAFILIAIILLPITYAALGHTVVDCSYLRRGSCAVEY
ncbi:hypothetical protein A2791_01995 [Candidatus Saccharibacteria bacterium RIFCSPHIGHO2_01_FULL_46_30]|nr:MAG: hypothetical protein A2791_01995 [Candidatus Saccharibacteria bacterium RIFCSPHIGHO2_01_FULL_46_30]